MRPKFVLFFGLYLVKTQYWLVEKRNSQKSPKKKNKKTKKKKIERKPRGRGVRILALFKWF